jgi:hypothetical protein
MKVKFALLLSVLLIILAVPVSAQDPVKPRNPRPVGTVSTSQTRNIEPIGARQVGLGSRAEAIVQSAWYGSSGSLVSNFVGTAISRIISGNGNFTACAQVRFVIRNSVTVASTGQSCGVIQRGGQIQMDARAFANWSNSTWHVSTWHQFVKWTSVWEPILYQTVNL